MYTDEKQLGRKPINKAQLLAVCVLATFIISGVVTTMGLIIPGAAAHFNVEVTSMASQFTWLTGGVFVGYILSFVVFDYFSIKSTLITNYLICLISIGLIYTTNNYTLLAAWFTLFGIAISIAVCGSGTLITRIWTGKARQTVLVAQDALFNGGGIIFSIIATHFITNQFPFASTYLVVAAVIVFVLILSLISNFDKDLLAPDESEQDLKTEWNAGIILVGISLLLFMMAKISMFIWAPQYVEQHFQVDSNVSGKFMSNIFTAALIGALISTWLASRMAVKYLLYGFIVVSAASVWLLGNATDIDTVLILAYLYGVSVSATFNAYMAFALTFVATPTHRNIAYMLLMSGLGSSAAPLFSSQAVQMNGEIYSALMFCFITLLAVILTLIGSQLLSQHARA